MKMWFEKKKRDEVRNVDGLMDVRLVKCYF